MNGDKNLTKLIREIIRDELKLSGGTRLITSPGDIDIVTKGTHVARYNGVEIATGGTAIVTSFNGRTGAVSPIVSDYDSFFLKLTGDTMVGSISFDGTVIGGGSAILLANSVISEMPTNRAWGSIQTDWAISKSDLVGSGGIFGSASVGWNMNSTMDAGAGKILIPRATSIPGNCVEGQMMWDKDKDQLWIGTGTNTWKEVGGGKIYLNTAKTIWIVANGNNVEIHFPVGGALRTVPY